MAELLDRDVVDRVLAIDWFVNCGHVFVPSGDLKVVAIDSWKAAKRHIQSPEWEAATLGASNMLSTHLYWTDVKEYSRKWNGTAIAANDFFNVDVHPKLVGIARANKLSTPFYEDVKRTLRGAFLERCFQHLNPPISFFSELLRVLEAGHYPCGWTQVWPEGELVVL
jgi:hypothetical protein